MNASLEAEWACLKNYGQQIIYDARRQKSRANVRLGLHPIFIVSPVQQHD